MNEELTPWDFSGYGERIGDLIETYKEERAEREDVSYRKRFGLHRISYLYQSSALGVHGVRADPFTSSAG